MGTTRIKTCIRAFVALAATALADPVVVADVNPAATAKTRALNAAVVAELPFDDTADFDNARRGFLAPLPNDGVIRGAHDDVVWNQQSYQYGNDAAAPDTVNPSLWRQQQLLAIGGLFEVVPGIYQVRGADASNLTVVEGKTGLIVVDPLTNTETAQAAMNLYYQRRGKKPVVAVIYTHSHVDHFGGVQAIVDPADVSAGRVQIIAPEHFVEEMVSENIFAATHMTRRAGYQFGAALPRSPTGQVTSGLALGVPSGTISLIRPTREIGPADRTLTIDGLRFEFLLAPETEAPAEMHVYITDYKAVTAAENVNHVQHNVYALRGAKPRNALAWSRAINQTLVRWGNEAEVLFGPHLWPVWGRENVTQMLEMQRDLYKYLNDQTLRLANLGYNMTEAAETVSLPRDLAQFWGNRGYYGTVNHNVKGIWSYYLGWHDGNPARLHPLPPRAAGERFVAYMGGADNVLERAQQDYAKGEYRWVAQVLDVLVSAQPTNGPARRLLADALTQLGYQAESAVWRNTYLSGAMELRAGVRPAPSIKAESPGVMQAVGVEDLLSALAIRLNGPRADGRRIAINIEITDSGETYGLVLKHSVLNTLQPVADPDLSLRLQRDALAALFAGRTSMEDLRASGRLTASGNPEKFHELAGLLDRFESGWDIMAPTDRP